MNKNVDWQNFLYYKCTCENVSKSTIYNIIKRREKGFDYIRRVGSGRPI